MILERSGPAGCFLDGSRIRALRQALCASGLSGPLWPGEGERAALLALHLEPAGPLRRLPAWPEVTVGSCPSDARRGTHSWSQALGRGSEKPGDEGLAGTPHGPAEGCAPSRHCRALLVLQTCHTLSPVVCVWQQQLLILSSLLAGWACTRAVLGWHAWGQACLPRSASVGRPSPLQQPCRRPGAGAWVLAGEPQPCPWAGPLPLGGAVPGASRAASLLMASGKGFCCVLSGEGEYYGRGQDRGSWWRLSHEGIIISGCNKQGGSFLPVHRSPVQTCSPSLVEPWLHPREAGLYLRRPWCWRHPHCPGRQGWPGDGWRGVCRGSCPFQAQGYVGGWVGAARLSL